MTKAKFKELKDNNVKHVSVQILKISFLTLFERGVKIRPDINPIYGQMDRPCPNDFKSL